MVAKTRFCTIISTRSIFTSINNKISWLLCGSSYLLDDPMVSVRRRL
jgi:hypothetical protein